MNADKARLIVEVLETLITAKLREQKPDATCADAIVLDTIKEQLTNILSQL